MSSPQNIDLHSIRRMVHLDFHLNDWVQNVCAGFDPKKTAKDLKDAGTQLVSVFAKDVYGHCFYPSQYSTMHPNLKLDYVGLMTQALKKENVPVITYYSAVYDAAGAKEFPDCLSMKAPNEPRSGGWMNKPGTELCFNSPYTEKRVLPQLEELVINYPIDGFWLDMVSWQAYEPCYCPHCSKGFKQISGKMIPRKQNSNLWMTYWNWKRERLADYHRVIRERLDNIRPGLILASNTLSTYANPENFVANVDMISTDPNADPRHLIFANRYDENQGVPRNFMVERFGQCWGHWSIREPHELKLESASILAHNGAVYFADQPLPSGNLQSGVIPLMKEVFDFVKEREEFCIGTRPVADIAVLHETNSFFQKYQDLGLHGARMDVEGAALAFTLRGEQVTALNEIQWRNRLNEFEILVLADQNILLPATESAIRDYVKNGGSLIATGETSRYDKDGKLKPDLGLRDVLGVSFHESCPFRNVFWQESPIQYQITSPSYHVITTTAEIAARLIHPIEESKGNFYTVCGFAPPGKETDFPAVTLNRFGKGIAVYAAFSFFRTYAATSDASLAHLAKFLLQLVRRDKQPLLKVDTESAVETSITKRGTEIFIHILNMNIDRRDSSMHGLARQAPARHIQLDFHCPTKPQSVILEPGRKFLHYLWENTHLKMTVDRIDLYGIVKIQM